MEKVNQFPAVWTALVTPFKNKNLDEESYIRLLKYQYQNGIRGFVVAGSTGEGGSLLPFERIKLVQLIRTTLPSDISIMMGTGTISLHETIANTLQAKELGVDAALVVVPPYVKAPQRGLISYFKEICSRVVGIPLILYNVPSRSVGKLEIETIDELFLMDQIVGIKEASGDLELARKLISKWSGKKKIYSGDDESSMVFRSFGGDGVISVASHVLPRAFLKNDIQSQRELIRGLYIESNPIPVKYALYAQGILRSPELRLPLVELDSIHCENLRKLLGGHKDAP